MLLSTTKPENLVYCISILQFESNKTDDMPIGTKLCFVLLQRYQSDSRIWLQNTFGKFP